MSDVTEVIEERIPLDDENDRFFAKFKPVMEELYSSARTTNELDFIRTITTDLWNSGNADTSIAAETQMFFNDYVMYLDRVELDRLNLRIMLGFYCQLARGAGYYQIVANLLRIVGGERYREWPFDDQSAGLTVTNSGSVLRVLADQATLNGRTELAGMLSEAFNQDLVASYDRADLLLSVDGIRLLHKNGGEPALVTLAEFHAWFERGITLFELLQKITAIYLTKCKSVKKITGQLDDGPEQEYTVHVDLRKREMIITG